MAGPGKPSSAALTDRERPRPSDLGRVGSLGGMEDRLLRASPTILRIGAGLLWLSNVAWKVPPSFGRSAQGCRGLCAFVNHGVEDGVVGPWRWLLERLVAPNLGLFGWLTLAVEFTLAAALLSGRFTRTAALAGMVQSMAIGLSVANAPGEWYWSYALMILLHLGVFATAARGIRAPIRPALVSAAVVSYGVLMAVANARNPLFAARRTRDWLLVGGPTGFPGDFGRSTLGGSIALGVLVAVAGIVGGRMARGARAHWLGAGLASVAVLGVLTYDDGGNVLGATPASLAVVAALGIWLIGTRGSGRPADA